MGAPAHSDNTDCQQYAKIVNGGFGRTTYIVDLVLLKLTRYHSAQSARHLMLVKLYWQSIIWPNSEKMNTSVIVLQTMFSMRTIYSFIPIRKTPTRELICYMLLRNCFVTANVWVLSLLWWRKIDLFILFLWNTSNSRHKQIVVYNAATRHTNANILKNASIFFSDVSFTGRRPWTRSSVSE